MVSSERESELLSPHHRSIFLFSFFFCLFLPYSAAALVIFYSFLKYIYIFFYPHLYKRMLLEHLSVTQSNFNCANFLSWIQHIYRPLLVPFIWWWVNWGHKQKEAEKPCAVFLMCIVSIMLVYGCADASQVATEKVLSTFSIKVWEQSVISESEFKNWERAADHYWRFTWALILMQI